MARLIDADALIEVMAKSHEAHSQNARDDSLLARDIRLVNEQPTAYDIEKVVEKLKEKKLLLCSKGVNQFNSILWCEGFCNTCVILDIIRKGGAE